MRYDEILNTRVIGDQYQKDFLEKYIIKYEDINEIAIEYYILDGNTPESIAEKVYGNMEYEWIIMLINKINNRNNDWPLTSSALLKYVMKKYDGDVHGIHHYEDSLGNIVQDDTKTPISNYTFEERINNKKRNIHVPTMRFLERFKREVYRNLS
jgi:hypothetical protein